MILKISAQPHKVYLFHARVMAPPSKRRKTNQIEEITFNPSARQEYLTGFHKRKLQRKENAREAALKREKEERVRERRQVIHTIRLQSLESS